MEGKVILKNIVVVSTDPWILNIYDEYHYHNKPTIKILKETIHGDKSIKH